jgi:hypothetical protein
MRLQEPACMGRLARDDDFTAGVSAFRTEIDDVDVYRIAQ